VEIQKRLARQDLPIWVQNDVNAATLGEMVFGAARGCSDFVYIAIGTGLGAGAMVSGNLLEGAYSRAMEIGHLPLDPQGRQCVCGQRGCPEMYISGIGFQAAFREHRSAYPQSALARLDWPSSKDVLDAARSKDPLALTLLDEASDRLSTVLITCMRLLDPELFVIGGGVGLAAYDLLHDELIRKVHSRATSATKQVASVVRSQIENSAVGAACLVWYCQGNNNA
jgi:glucokinase